MKRKLFFIIFIFITFLIQTKPLNASTKIIDYSKSAIVVELETGDVLYEYEADKKSFPASTTKIMTLKLVYDAIKTGIIKKDQLLTTSEYASSMGGSQIFLSVGEKMSVTDLLKAVVIASANDAAVVLGEAIYGNINSFVQKMNDEAKRLQMNSTYYKNATGLHDNQHVTSARDLSIISRELLLNYQDEVLQLSSTYEDYLRKDTSKPFWLVNTNKLIKSKNQIDGLKTGWTNEAGYCLVATKQQDNMRIISVVLGADTANHRNEDTIKLLNYTFANFEKQLISPKGTIVKTDENYLFNPTVYNIVLSKDLVRIVKKNDQDGLISYEIVIDKNEIPNKNSSIGQIKVYIDHKLYQTIDLELKEKVTKSTFFELLLNILKNII